MKKMSFRGYLIELWTIYLEHKQTEKKTSKANKKGYCFIYLLCVNDLSNWRDL